MTRDVDDEEGIRGCESLPPRNSAFLQGRLIAMGHAHEELIIKIKYCDERVASLLFYSTMRSGGTERDATPAAAAAAAATAAVVLWFSAPQAVIYIIKHT